MGGGSSSGENTNPPTPPTPPVDDEKEPGVIENKPEAKNQIYNGAAQKLLDDTILVSSSTGEILYAVNNSSNAAPALDKFTNEIPTAINAGTYYVWYYSKATDTESYKDTAPLYVKSIIEKLASTISDDASSIIPLTYNGGAQTLITEATSNDGTVKYRLGNDSYSTNLPQATNAGTYTIYYKAFANDDNHKDSQEKSLQVVINKATMTGVSVTNGVGTYNEQAQTGGASVTYPEGMNIVYGKTTSYGSTAIPTYKNAGGPYTVYFKVTDPNNNYKDYEGEFTITIKKASGSYASLPVGDTTLVYNDENQPLLKELAQGTGIVTYNVDNADDFGVNNPEAKNVKDYKVGYKMEESDNYLGIDTPQYVNAKINKKKLTVKITNGVGAYTGEATDGGAKVEIEPAGVATIKYGTSKGTIESNTVPTFTDCGTNTIYYKIEDANGIYESESGSLTITIAKAAGDVKAPTLNDLTYNGEYQTLIGNATSTTGVVKYSLDGLNYIYDKDNLPKGKDAGTYRVYYKVESTDPNYQNVEPAYIDVTIKQKQMKVIKYDGDYKGNVCVQQPSVIVQEPNDNWTIKYGEEEGEYTLNEIPDYSNETGNYAVYFEITTTNTNYATYHGTINVNVTDNYTLVTEPESIVATYTGDPIGEKVDIIVKVYRYNESEEEDSEFLVPIETATVLYSVDNVDYTDVKPTFTDVGVYSVYYNVTNGDLYQESNGNYTITITPAMMDVSVKGGDVMYNGELQNGNPTVTVNTEGINTTIKYGTKEGEYTLNEIPKYIDAGTYPIYFKITEEKGNYKDYVGSFSVVIRPAIISATCNDVKVNFNDGPQTGDPKVVVTNPISGTIVTYSTEKDGTYSNVIPSYTDAGVYDIFYKVHDNKGNFEDYIGTYKLTINPADILILKYDGVDTYSGEETNGGAYVEVLTPESNAIVKFGTEEGTYDLDEVPKFTNAGTYTVYFKVLDEKNNYYELEDTLTIIINKKDIEATSSNASKVYDGESFDGGDDVIKVIEPSSDYTITYGEIKGEYSSTKPSITDVNNSKTIYFKISAGDNYNDYEGSYKLEVTKAPSTYITKPSAKENLVFDEHGVELINVGSTDCGTIMYYVGSLAKCKDDLTKFSENGYTSTLAGEHTVCFYIKGDDNHEDSLIESVDVNVTAQKTVLDNLPSENKVTLTYNTQPQSLVSNTITTNPTSDTAKIKYKLGANDTTAPTTKAVIPGSDPTEYEDTYSEEIPTQTNAGTYYVWAYGNANIDNYTEGDPICITVTIKKADGIAKAPYANSLTYNGEDQVLISASEGSSGTVKYKVTTENTKPENKDGFSDDITTIIGKAQGDYYIWYYACESNNYYETDIIDTPVKVTIEASTSLPITVTNGKATYTGSGLSGGANVTSTISGFSVLYGTSEGTYDLSSMPKYTDVGTYTVYFKASAPNYSDKTSSLIIEITKADAKYTKAIKPLTLTYTGEEQTLIEAATTSDGTIYYKLGNGEYSTELPKATDVGEYTIYYKLVADNNHNDIAEQTVTAVINKVAASVNINPAKDLVYNKEAQALIETADTKDAKGNETGTILYSLDGNDFLEDIPTRTNAGDYTVYYKVKGDKNHADVDAKSIIVKIAKADITKDDIDILPQMIEELVYNGEKQDLITAGQTSVGTLMYENIKSESPLIDSETGKEYQQVEYVQSNGSQYIDTGIKTTNYYDFDIEFQYYITISDGGYICGTYYDGIWSNGGKIGSSLRIAAFYDLDDYYDIQKNIWYRVRTNYSTENVYFTDYSNSSSSEKLFYTATHGYNYTAKETFTLFANRYSLYPGGTTSVKKGSVRIRKFVMRDHGNVVRNMVPVKQADANVYGMFDLVENKFYGSKTSYSFTGAASSGDGDKYLTSVPQAIDADTYQVHYYVKGNENYNDSEIFVVEPDAEIAKAQGSFTSKPTVKDLTYTGEDQILINGGSSKTGTLQYSLPDTEYSTTLPVGNKAGDYSVYYRILGDKNHEDVDVAEPLTVTIKKATPVVTAPTAIKDLVFNGNNQKLISAGSSTFGELSYSFDQQNYVSDVELVKALDAGDYTIYYKVIAEDDDNYVSSEEKSITVTIDKAKATVDTDPVGNTELDYTGSEQDLLKSLGSSNNGTLRYAISDSNDAAPADELFTLTTMPKATDVGTYYVWYYAKGNENYYDSDKNYVVSKITGKAAAGLPHIKTGFKFDYQNEELVLSLPEGYEQLEYLNFDGGQYIDLGFKANQTSKAEVEFAYNAQGANTKLFGDRNADRTIGFTFSMYYTDLRSSDNMWSQFGTDKASNSSNIPTSYTTKRQKVTLSSDITRYGDSYYRSHSTLQDFETERTILLGTYRDGDVIPDTRTSAKIYYAKFYEAGILKHYYIPVHDTVNDKYGMYDLIGAKEVSVEGEMTTVYQPEFLVSSDESKPFDAAKQGPVIESTTPLKYLINKVGETAPTSIDSGDWKDTVTIPCAGKYDVYYYASKTDDYNASEICGPITIESFGKLDHDEWFALGVNPTTTSQTSTTSVNNGGYGLLTYKDNLFSRTINSIRFIPTTDGQLTIYAVESFKDGSDTIVSGSERVITVLPEHVGELTEYIFENIEVDGNNIVVGKYASNYGSDTVTFKYGGSGNGVTGGYVSKVANTSASAATSKTYIGIDIGYHYIEEKMTTINFVTGYEDDPDYPSKLDSVQIEYGTSYTLPVAVPGSKYRLDGWANIEGDETLVKSPITCSQDEITLYAKWHDGADAGIEHFNTNYKYESETNPVYTIDSKYEQLEFLYFDGRQYLDLGFKANETSKAVIDFNFNSSTESGSSKLFGDRQTSDSRGFDFAMSSGEAQGGALWDHFGATWSKAWGSPKTKDITARNVVTLSPDGISYIGYSNTHYYNQKFETPNTVKLGTYFTGGADPGKYVHATIYSAKFYEAGILTHYYVPVRTLDNDAYVYGMLDVCTNEFKQSATQTAFEPKYQGPVIKSTGALKYLIVAKNEIAPTSITDTRWKDTITISKPGTYNVYYYAVANGDYGASDIVGPVEINAYGSLDYSEWFATSLNDNNPTSQHTLQTGSAGGGYGMAAAKDSLFAHTINSIELIPRSPGQLTIYLTESYLKNYQKVVDGSTRTITVKPEDINKVVTYTFDDLEVGNNYVVIGQYDSAGGSDSATWAYGGTNSSLQGAIASNILTKTGNDSRFASKTCLGVNIGYTSVSNKKIKLNYVPDNGGSIDSVEIAYGTEYSLPVPTKDGYHFAGWYTNADFSGQRIADLSGSTISHKITTDIFKWLTDDEYTLYAKWVANDVYNYFEGKTIAIYGDDISTIANNGHSNVNYDTIPNAMLASGVTSSDAGVPTSYTHWYGTNTMFKGSISADSTYWGQFILDTDAKLLSNRSYSGTYIDYNTTAMANYDRINEIKTNDTDPDIIFIYGGTNDYANADKVAIGTGFDSTASYVTKLDKTTTSFDSFIQAYSIMINRVRTAYPNSEIIILEPYTYKSSRDTHNLYLDQIAECFNLKVVDFGNTNNGNNIYTNAENEFMVSGDKSHPSNLGFAKMTQYMEESLAEQIPSEGYAKTPLVNNDYDAMDFDATEPLLYTINSDYKQVEYVEFDGTQYIDLGFKATDKTKFEIEYTYNALNNSKLGSDVVFGDATNSSATFKLYNNSNKIDGSSKMRVSAGKYSTQYATFAGWGISYKNKTKVTLEKGNMKMDSSISTTIPTSTETFETAGNIMLAAAGMPDKVPGSADYETAYPSYGQITVYSFKVYNDGLLTKYFVPVEKVNGGEIGLLEVLSNTFYGKAKGNDFEKPLPTKESTGDLMYLSLATGSDTPTYETSGWSTELNVPIDAESKAIGGIYDLYYYAKENGTDYTKSKIYGPITYTIHTPKPHLELAKELKAKTLYCNGFEQYLLEELGTIKDNIPGTVYYSIDGGTTYYDKMPKGIDAKEYDVTYMIVPEDTVTYDIYYSSTDETVKVEIEKGEGSFNNTVIYGDEEGIPYDEKEHNLVSTKVIRQDGDQVYQQMEYLNVNAAWYFELTDIKPTKDTTVVLDFGVDTISNNTYLFNTDKETNGDQAYQATIYNNSLSLGTSDSTKTNIASTDYKILPGRYTLTYNDKPYYGISENAMFTISGVEKASGNTVNYSTSLNVSDFGDNYLIIGRRGSKATSKNIRIYSLKIYDKNTGELINNLVPEYCQTFTNEGREGDFNGAIGLYDTINEKYYGGTRDQEARNYDVGDGGAIGMELPSNISGVIKYTISDQGESAPTDLSKYSTNIPKAIEKGTYYVWYYVDENNNFNSMPIDQPKSFKCVKTVITEPISYNITYHNMDGATNHVDNPDTYSAVTDTFQLKPASKDNYVFDAWYDSEELTNKVTQIEKGTSGDIELYAKWYVRALPHLNTSYRFDSTLDSLVYSLPTDYEEIEYLYFDGGQYIDLGFKVNQTSKIEVDFKYNKQNDNYGSSFLFGVKDAYQKQFAVATKDGRINENGDNTTLVAYYYSEQSNFENQTLDIYTTRNTVTLTPDAASYNGQENIIIGLKESSIFTTTNNIRLGSCYTYNSTTYEDVTSYLDASVYSVKFYDAGLLTHYLIPVHNKVKDTYGMYDLIAQKYLVSAAKLTADPVAKKEFDASKQGAICKNTGIMMYQVVNSGEAAPTSISEGTWSNQLNITRAGIYDIYFYETASGDYSVSNIRGPITIDAHGNLNHTEWFANSYHSSINTSTGTVMHKSIKTGSFGIWSAKDVLYNRIINTIKLIPSSSGKLTIYLVDSFFDSEEPVANSERTITVLPEDVGKLTEYNFEPLDVGNKNVAIGKYEENGGNDTVSWYGNPKSGYPDDNPVKNPYYYNYVNHSTIGTSRGAAEYCILGIDLGYSLAPGKASEPVLASDLGLASENLVHNTMIPDGYEQIEYLQFDGKQYINTGYKPTNNTKIVMDFDANAAMTSSTSTTNELFGSTETSNQPYKSYQLCIYNKTLSFGLSYSNYTESLSNTTYPYKDGRHILTYDSKSNGTRTVSLKGINGNTENWTYTKTGQADFKETYDLLIGKRGAGSSVRYGEFKLYSCQVYDEDEIMMSLIPVKRTFDGAYGLYDVMNQKFIGYCNTKASGDGSGYPANFNSGNQGAKANTGKVKYLYQAQGAAAPTSTSEGEWSYNPTVSVAGSYDLYYFAEESETNKESSIYGPVNFTYDPVVAKAGFAVAPSINTKSGSIYTLPEGYTQIEYLRFNKNQYIATDYEASFKTKLVMDFEADKSSSANYLFGTTKSSTAYQQFTSCIYQNSLSVGKSNSDSEDLSSTLYPYTSGRHTLTYNEIREDGNRYTTLKGINGNKDAWSFGTNEITTNDFDTTNNYKFWIGSRGNASSGGHGNYKLYSLQLFEMNESGDYKIKYNFVPVRNPEGKFGLYDTINEKFYGTSASEFVKVEQGRSSTGTVKYLVQHQYEEAPKDTSTGNWTTTPSVAGLYHGYYDLYYYAEANTNLRYLANESEIYGPITYEYDTEEYTALAAEPQIVKKPVTETSVIYSLPQGLTQVEYLTFTGNQYIDTDYKPTVNTKLVIDFAARSYNSGNQLFGTMKSSESYRDYQACLYQHSFSIGGNTGSHADLDYAKYPYIAGRHTLTYNDYQNGTKHYTLKSLDGNSDNWDYPYKNSSGWSNNNIFIGMRNGTWGKYMLYSLQIYEEGEIVRNYVPFVDENGKYGLYDFVNGRAYYASTANSGQDFVTGKQGPTVPNQSMVYKIVEKGSARPIENPYVNSSGWVDTPIVNEAGEYDLYYAGKYDSVYSKIGGPISFSAIELVKEEGKVGPQQPVLDLTTATSKAVYTLPSNYTQLEYLQFGGTQYIATDYEPNLNTKTVIDFDSESMSDSNILIGTSKSSDYHYAQYYAKVYQNSMSFGLQEANDATGVVDLSKTKYPYTSGRHILTYNETKDDGFRYSTLVGVDNSDYFAYATDKTKDFDTTNDYKLYIGSTGKYAAQSKAGKFKLYSLQVYEGDEIVFSFVPVKDSNDKYGLYDLVGGKFYESSYSSFSTESHGDIATTGTIKYLVQPQNSIAPTSTSEGNWTTTPTVSAAGSYDLYYFAESSEYYKKSQIYGPYNFIVNGTEKEIGRAGEPIIATDLETASNQLVYKLPSEYTAIEYLHFTGSQYIDTKYIPKLNSTKIVLDFDEDSLANDDGMLFGTSKAPSSGAGLPYARIWDNSMSFGLSGSTSTSQGVGFVDNLTNASYPYSLGRHILTYNEKRSDGYRYFSLKGLYGINDNWSYKTNGTTEFSNETIIIGYRGKNSRYGKYKLYSMQIYENNEIAMNLIPVKKSDGSYGLYDIENEKFYGATAGTFTAANQGRVSNTGTVKYFVQEQDEQAPTISTTGWLDSPTVTKEGNYSLYYYAQSSEGYIESKIYGPINFTVEETRQEGRAGNPQAVTDLTTASTSAIYAIPSDYEEIEYLKFTGSQYIQIDYTASFKTMTVMDFYSEVNTGTDNKGALFGTSRSGDNEACQYTVKLYNGAMNIGINNSSSVSLNSSANRYKYNTGRHILTYNENTPEGIRYTSLKGLDGNTDNWKYGTSVTSSDFKNSSNYKFRIGSRGNQIGKFTLYSLQMYEDGVLIYDFIPVMKKADRTYGVYDVVNGKFYGATSGTFASDVQGKPASTGTVKYLVQEQNEEAPQDTSSGNWTTTPSVSKAGKYDLYYYAESSKGYFESNIFGPVNFVVTSDQVEEGRPAEPQIVDNPTINNNLVIDHILPEGYTQIEYLYFSGAQYINTNYVPKNTTKTVMDFESIEYDSSSNELFGTSKSDEAYKDYTSCLYQYSMSVGYSATTYKNLSSSSFPFIAGRHVLTYNDLVSGTKYYRLEGVDVNNSWEHSTTDSNKYSQTERNLYIGRRASSYGTFRLYSFKMYNSGTLVRDYIPVINSEGKYGLYDFANSTFYGYGTSKNDFVAASQGQTVSTGTVKYFVQKANLDAPTSTALGGWTTTPTVSDVGSYSLYYYAEASDGYTESKIYGPINFEVTGDKGFGSAGEPYIKDVLSDDNMVYDIPEGYTQVKYIKFNGKNNASKQYITTDIVPTKDTTLVMDFYTDHLATTTSGEWDVLFGQTNGTKESYEACLYNSGFYVGLDSSSVKNLSTSGGTYAIGRHIFTYNDNDKFKLSTYNEYTKEYEQQWEIADSNPGGDYPDGYLTIGKRNTTDGLGGTFRLYSLKLYDSGVLTHYLVPVKNSSDVYGVIDLVDSNHKFYSSSNSSYAFEARDIATTGDMMYMIKPTDLTGPKSTSEDGWSSNILLNSAGNYNLYYYAKSSSSYGESDICGPVRITAAKVNFNVNGGDNFDAEIVNTTNSPYKLSEVPTRSGYKFEGWFTTRNGGTQVKEIPMNSTKEYTVYAHWSPLETMASPKFGYTIVYDLDGGINNKSNPTNYIPIDEEIVLLDATRDGYEFVGWFDDVGNEVLSLTNDINSDLTLHAKWNPITYYLSYYLDEDMQEVYKQVEFTVESDELELITLQIEDKEFIGWYDLEGNEVTSIPANSIGDITLIAKFKDIDEVPEELPPVDTPEEQQSPENSSPQEEPEEQQPSEEPSPQEEPEEQQPSE